MSKTHIPSKGGRPPVDTEALTLRLPRKIIDSLDDVRRVEKDIPNRPEIIRRILIAWLKENGRLKE